MTEEQGSSEMAAELREVDAPAEDRDLPAVYCNSPQVTISLSDICIALNAGVGPQQRVYMSHIAAKTLAQQLQQMIAAFEAAAGFEVPTMNQVQVAFNEYQQAGTKEGEE